MTTLAADSIREQALGDIGEYPVIASDIIYQGAAVGLVDATGHARPLTAVDRFVGFAISRADNSAGTAAAISVRVSQSGDVVLPVTGALITDVGQAVYAQDDNAFSFNPVAGIFVGFVTRYVSAGVVVVAYGPKFVDPWADYSIRETLAGTKTLDKEDCGKLFCFTEAADGDDLTLPAKADGLSGFTCLYVGAFGGAAIDISPAAADMIYGLGTAAVDDKDVILTKATARRGDFIRLANSISTGDVDADGYHITASRGTWTREA